VVKHIQEETPANAMGNSSSSSGPIQTFDPLISKVKKMLRRRPIEVAKTGVKLTPKW